MGMVQFVHHPAVWRYRAALTRVAAEHGAANGAKEHELKLAAFYERLAQYAEERVSCERARRRLLPAPSRAGLLSAPSRAGLIAGPHDGDGQAVDSQTERIVHDLLKAAEEL
jgi:hypothetical protein